MMVIKLDKTNSAEVMNRSDYIMHMIEILVDESKIIKKNCSIDLVFVYCDSLSANFQYIWSFYFGLNPVVSAFSIGLDQ